MTDQVRGIPTRSFETPDRGLELRQAVHVGEVELVGRDVRELAIHEAARIMAAAAPGEILVSAITRSLAGSSGHVFEARASRELKGLPGAYELLAVGAST
ncbi:MAG: hypothetical protein FJ038_11595 [Chloroflexi bacterium]|nr:hypothetical protein [Chloroflexota bacterium]